MGTHGTKDEVCIIHRFTMHTVHGGEWHVTVISFSETIAILVIDSINEVFSLEFEVVWIAIPVSESKEAGMLDLDLLPLEFDLADLTIADFLKKSLLPIVVVVAADVAATAAYDCVFEVVLEVLMVD